MSKKLVIIGASGHGKVIADIALKNGYEIVGFLDDNDSLQEICGFPVLGSIKNVCQYKENCEFVIAIGNNEIREKIATTYDVKWATLIHPSAIIGMQVQIGEGTVIMANAVINPCVTIGRHCIINTGAIVEHDNAIEDYVHISVGVKLAGTVFVGHNTWIGIGAVVSNNLRICDNCVIRAGAVVVDNIDKSGNYQGVPAKIKE